MRYPLVPTEPAFLPAPGTGGYLVSETRDGPFVDALALDGSVRFSHRVAEGKVVRVMADDGNPSPHLYVLSPRSLVAVDDTGNVCGRLDFQSPDGNRPVVVHGGRVVVGDDNSLLVLDSILTVKSRTPLRFKPEVLHCLDDGSLLVGGRAYPNSLLHLASDASRVHLKREGVRVDSLTIAGKTLWYVESQYNTMARLHCYDFSRHRDQVVATVDAYATVIPIADGACVEVRGTGGAHTLEVHDSNGEHATFSSLLNQLQISADGRTAWTVCREPDPGGGTAPHFVLYRIPLLDKTSRPPFFNPFFPLPKASIQEKHEVYRSEGTHEEFQPFVLADGRIAIMTSLGSHLLAADGAFLGTFSTLDALLVAVGRDARLGASIVPLVPRSGGRHVMDKAEEQLRLHRGLHDATSRASAPQPSNGLEEWLRLAALDYGVPALSPPLDDEHGQVSFTRLLTPNQAAAELGIPSPEALAALVDGRGTINLALRSHADVWFGGSVPGCVSASSSSVTLLGGDGHTEVDQVSLESGHFTSVLPLIGDGRGYVAAGTSDGTLVWMTVPPSGPPPPPDRFSLGSPLVGLSLVPDNRVLAVGDREDVLVLEPSLPHGEILRLVPSLSEPTPSPTPDAIRQGDDVVIIGGITIPRRKT